jgi:hypothetical protein
MVKQDGQNLRLGIAHCAPGAIVTETKSRPNRISVTSPSENSACANGEASASSGEVNARVPLAITCSPGRNLSVAGFGVVSVSMNMTGHLGPGARVKRVQACDEAICALFWLGGAAMTCAMTHVLIRSLARLAPLASLVRAGAFLSPGTGCPVRPAAHRAAPRPAGGAALSTAILPVP